jgi:hypothetical protein
MLDLHLYFVKLLGCQIVEGKIPIETEQFSKSLLGRRPHPNLYLAFGHLKDMPVLAAGGSDVHADLVSERAVFVAWLYHTGDLCVRVMYAEPGEHRQGLTNSWHPKMGSKRIAFSPI